MKKKIIGILVMILLITTVFTSVGLEENTCGIEIKLSSRSSSTVELEDQHNLYDNYSGISLNEGKFLAQGFTPAHTPLTKVILYLQALGGSGNPPENVNLTVSIRETLEEDDIISKTVNLDDIVSIIKHFNMEALSYRRGYEKAQPRIR